jgi:hypothetical protein
MSELEKKLKLFENWWNRAFDWEQGLKKDLPTERDLDVMRVAFINGYDIAMNTPSQSAKKMIAEGLDELNYDFVHKVAKKIEEKYGTHLSRDWRTYDNINVTNFLLTSLSDVCKQSMEGEV